MSHGHCKLKATTSISVHEKQNSSANNIITVHEKQIKQQCYYSARKTKQQ